LTGFAVCTKQVLESQPPMLWFVSIFVDEVWVQAAILVVHVPSKELEGLLHNTLLAVGFKGLAGIAATCREMTTAHLCF